MAGEKVFFCAMCNSMRQQANHWFLGFLRNDALVIQPWSDGVAKLPTAMPLCGQWCTHKLLDKFISGNAA